MLLIVLFHIITISLVFCVLSINIVQNLFWLSFSYILGSIILLTIGLEWLSVVILIIYTGAIAVLFLISLMMVNPSLVGNQLLPSTVFKKPNIIQGLYIILVIIIIKNYIINESIEYNNQYSSFCETVCKNNELVSIAELFFNSKGVILILGLIILIIPMIGVLIFVVN